MNSKYNPMGMTTEKNQIITPEAELFGGGITRKTPVVNNQVENFLWLQT